MAALLEARQATRAKAVPLMARAPCLHPKLPPGRSCRAGARHGLSCSPAHPALRPATSGQPPRRSRAPPASQPQRPQALASTTAAAMPEEVRSMRATSSVACAACSASLMGRALKSVRGACTAGEQYALCGLHRCRRVAALRHSGRQPVAGGAPHLAAHRRHRLGRLVAVAGGALHRLLRRLYVLREQRMEGVRLDLVATDAGRQADGRRRRRRRWLLWASLVPQEPAPCNCEPPNRTLPGTRRTGGLWPPPKRHTAR